ncbi:MAG: hypothetical protein JNM07_10940 [Phycisphaerae bacterium]|nr:hypothetical protein [Phycisphaerae bacterium]
MGLTMVKDDVRAELESRRGVIEALAGGVGERLNAMERETVRMLARFAVSRLDSVSLRASRVSSNEPAAGADEAEAEKLGRLTPTQRELLPLLLQGLSVRDIAEKIGRSPYTVHDHVKAIYTALGVRKRVQLLHHFKSMWSRIESEARKQVAKDELN